MAVQLHPKYEQMVKDAEERIEFGDGYVLHPAEERRCSLTHAPRLTLTSKGALKYEPPCTTMEFHFIDVKGAGEGSKAELLQAAQEGRIKTGDLQEFTAAVESGRVLYLRQVSGVLLLSKRDGMPEQPVDHHVFFTSTQREEAITEIADRLRKCTHRLFSTHNLKEKDILAVAAFISLQLP